MEPLLIEPLVSIILPTHNGMPYLEQAIGSLLAQTYANLEILIIDDGSTDDTYQFLQSIKSPIVKVVRNPTNLGLVASLNNGLEFARGQFVARMDADDICFPTRIEKQVAFMRKNPDVGICGSAFETFGAYKTKRVHPLGSRKIVDQFLTKGCVIGHPTVMIRSSLIKEYRYFYSSDFTHAEDYELWTRFVGHTKFANLKEVLLKYRCHNSQVSTIHAQKQESLTRLIRYNLVARTLCITDNCDLIFLRQLCLLDKIDSLKDLESFISSIPRLISINKSQKIFTSNQFVQWLYDSLYHLAATEKLEINILKLFVKCRPKINTDILLPLAQILLKLSAKSIYRYYDNIPSLPRSGTIILTLCGPASSQILKLADAIHYCKQSRKKLVFLPPKPFLLGFNDFIFKNQQVIETLLSSICISKLRFPISFFQKIRGYRAFIRPKPYQKGISYFEGSEVILQRGDALLDFFKSIPDTEIQKTLGKSGAVLGSGLILIVSCEFSTILAEKPDFYLQEVIRELSLKVSRMLEAAGCRKLLLFASGDEFILRKVFEKYEINSFTLLPELELDNLYHLGLLQKHPRVVLAAQDPFFRVLHTKEPAIE